MNVPVNVETEHIEFKSSESDRLYKSVIAFANDGGGRILIGADDEGRAIGSDIDDVYTRVTNGIRDAIAPDVTMFVSYELQPDGVIAIDVGEGSSKPYHLRSKGLKPSGVYIRQGASSVPASPEQIRRMIKEADGDDFESMRSIEQELTFNGARAAFDREGIEFSEAKYPALGMTSIKDGSFTNLALLLSDQCRHTIKAAFFADDDKTVFRASEEFSGAILAQTESAWEFVSSCNRTAAKIKGLRRDERHDYPEAALREAFINAIIHRDYSFSGSIIVNFSRADVEVISLGGLLPDLTPDDITSGISALRNRNLADIFRRLKMIEAYGTGLRRIFSLYKGHPVQPRIDVTPNTFKITLPNMNETAGVSASEKKQLSHQQQMIVEYLSAKGEIRGDEMQNVLGVGRTRTYMIARELIDSGVIEVSGRGEARSYRLVR